MWGLVGVIGNNAQTELYEEKETAKNGKKNIGIFKNQELRRGVVKV